MVVKEEHRARVAYQPVPAHEHRRLTQRIHVDESTCGGRLIKALWFQNVMGLIIIANAVVLGLETDIRGSWRYWDEAENGFLLLFLLEVVLKLFVEGPTFFHYLHDDFWWNLFDFLIVGLGVFDLVARAYLQGSGTGGFSTIFRLFRLLRILRIFRLLKFLRRLYLLAMGLIEAAKAIFWVTILMCFVLYVCALVLVKTVGRPPSSDPYHSFMDNHFGTIPETMITLFVLMSSPNLPIYQEEVGLLDSHPCLTMFLIAFITFGSFGMLAMLTGVINESMFENNELQKEEKRHKHETMRMSLGEKCADLFMTLDQNEDGEVSTEDVKDIAVNVVVLVEAAGAHIAHGDVHKIIEHMDTDNSGTLSIVEFVQAIEKIAEGNSPMAILELNHAIGWCHRKLESLDDRSSDTLKQVSEISRSMQRLERRDCSAESDQRLERMISRQTAEIGKMSSDQIRASESRLQFAVTHQADSGDGRLHIALGKQIEDIQRSVQKLLDGRDAEQHSRLSSTIEKIGDSMQKLHDRLPKSVDESQTALSQQVSEMQQSLQRLAEKESGDTRCQLVVAAQMQAIGTSVQKLLHEKDACDTQNSQELQEMRMSVQRLFEQLQQSSDTRVQQLQRQVDSAQESLLGGVAELGGVVLDGVGNLLSNRMAAMQTNLLGELETSHQLTLQKLFANGLPQASQGRV